MPAFFVARFQVVQGIDPNIFVKHFKTLQAYCLCLCEEAFSVYTFHRLDMLC